MTWCERPSERQRFGPIIATERVDGNLVGEPRAYDDASIAGPVTTWHDNGRIEAYGNYEVHRGRSLPHGVWTFWWDEGQLMSRGRYINGRRVGCFAMWSRHGARRTTAFAVGDEMRFEACEPPGHAEAEFAAHEVGGSPRAPRGDIAVSYFVAPWGSFGGSSSPGPEVDIEHAFGLRVQRRFACHRIGGNVGLRKGDHDGYLAAPVTFGFGHQWNQPGKAWSIEGSMEGGAHFVLAQPTDGDAESVGRVFQWTPMVAFNLEVAVSWGRYLDLVFGGRFEGRFPREVETQTLFRNPNGHKELDWQLGGVSVGPTFALRSRIW